MDTEATETAAGSDHRSLTAVLRFGPDAGALAGEHVLDPNEPTLIGRSSVAGKEGLRLPGEGPGRCASGLHASLMLDESGHWVVEDLGSKNGTLIDGERVPANTVVRLSPRASVQFGEGGLRAEFRLRADGETLASLPRAGYRIVLAPAETLYTRAEHFPFAQAVVRIGCAPGSDLEFPPSEHPEVSPHHARIEWTGAGFRLLDRSRRGTWVNGERVDSATLAAGNILQFGPGGPKLAVHSIETPQAGVETKALGELEAAIALLERESSQSRARERRSVRRRSFLFGGLGLAALGVGGVGLWRGLRPTPDERIKALGERHEGSLLLVYSRFRILVETDDDEPLIHQEGDSFGTAFFIDYAGHAITNRHVLEPWRGQDEYAASLAGAYSEFGKAKVEVESRIAAWPARSRFRVDDRIDYSAGFNDLPRRNLELVGMPKYSPVTQEIDGLEIERIPWDDSDLALLRLHDARIPAGSVAPLLPEGERPEVLAHVWAGGFPKGARILEGSRAIPTHTRGEVKKVERGYQLDLTVAGGSSGSPVLDLDGRVIGVITRAEGRHVELIPARAIRELAIEHGVVLPS